ncbi:MAG: amidohydrolase family protein [Robiginitomaculum sp.]|nr:amidohydrolase family protein [Robiginitomaculum sp.]
MRIFLIICSFAFVAFLAVPAFAQSIPIGAKYIVTNTPNGFGKDNILYVKNGIVTAVPASQHNNEVKNAISGPNLWVTPGIFAPFSTLGLAEVSGESDTNNINSADKEATVSIRAADSFNPKSTTIAVTRVGGVTHAAVVPGSRRNLFGGQGAIVTTSGAFDSILNPSAFVYMNYNGRSEQTGSTKGAAMAFMRSALDDAANYNRRFKAPTDGDALRRKDAQALRPVLVGRKPLLVSADQAVDILNLIKLKTSYPRMNMIIIGAAEGWMVAEALASAKVAVVVDPHENLPYSFDQIATRSDNVKLLHDAGVTTAIFSAGSTGGTAHNLRLMTQHAGNAVNAGLSWDAAFKAITLTPATLFGYPNLGQIRPGDKANLVVWDGDPLEITSAPIAVFIDGQLQSLESRQTKLRDRYNPNNTGDKMYGYR